MTGTSRRPGRFTPRSGFWTLALGPVLLSANACAARGIPDTLDPAAEARAVETTAPDRPLRAVFHWRLQERDARFNGRGVARVEAPHRARLDLFGPQGDGFLTAALVGADVRLPAGVAVAQLPPAAMMWAVLGVVFPPDRAVLAGTRETGDRVELYYRVDDGVLRFTLEHGRLRSARWEGAGRRMIVELSGTAPGGLPREALFRDLVEYTELVLNLEQVDEVEPFPPYIWLPGR